MKKIFLAYIVTLGLLFAPAVTFAQDTKGSILSWVTGEFVALNYNFKAIRVATQGGIAAASPASFLLAGDGSVALFDGRTIEPWFVGEIVTIGSGSNSESVTLTAVSGCSRGNQGGCTISGNTSNAHGFGDSIASSTAGLQEAIYNAFSKGGGLVAIGQDWASVGGTSAMLTAAPVFPGVTIKDVRVGGPRYWNPTPTGVMLAVPTTLTAQAACDTTHQFCSDATVAGSASYGSTLYGCVAYVDIMGNEGPCSLASTVFTSVASKAIDVQAPAASAGAVGYIVYLSLSGGSYAQAYQIPSTSSNCTLTTLETITPACAVTNTTYGQVGSTFGKTALFTTGGSQITTYPLNTAQHFTNKASIVMTTAAYAPMSNSSVSYSYAPSNRVGACSSSSFNAVSAATAAQINGSATAAIPMSVATWTLPANCFNYIGAEFRVSGHFTELEAGTSAATYKILVGWDAPLANATTIPMTVCDIENTHTPAAVAQNGYFSCTVKIQTVGTTGTAVVNGWGDMSVATGQALLIGFANDISTAASAATFNTTVPGRIVVYFFDSGNTVTTCQTIDATLEFLN